MSRYNALKAAAQWFSAIAHRLAVMLASIEDSVATATRKAELAVWDVEQRIHDKAISAARAERDQAHRLIREAHDKALQEVTSARRVLNNATARYEASAETYLDRLDVHSEAFQARVDLHS